MREFETGKWYVMDCMATTMQTAYMSGPFDSLAECDSDRRERNIADDCESFLMPTVCEWFVNCGREAAAIRPHPVLGNVPVCDTCAQFVDENS